MRDPTDARDLGCFTVQRARLSLSRNQLGLMMARQTISCRAEGTCCRDGNAATRTRAADGAVKRRRHLVLAARRFDAEASRPVGGHWKRLTSHHDHCLNLPKGENSMNKSRLLALATPVVLVAAFGVSKAFGEFDNDRRPYAIGLWGDLPYSTEQATVGVPNLIADMNAQRLAFTVHDGDLKAGSNSPCNNALYATSLAFFNQLEAPAAFTPGDNDWTDCDRANNGGFNSLERLDYERQVFFSTRFSFGKHRMLQEVQTAPLCLGFGGASVPCVENRRWTVGGVTYATLNVQGSCNNLCDTAPDANEYAARNKANIEWLKDTFAVAKRRKSAAVMLISQADPGWDLTDGTRAPTRDPKTLAETDGQPDGYQEFLLALRDEVIAFKKPVAYVHGDSHYMRIDRPFADSQGRRLENFTRVETFGDHQENGLNDVQWLKVVVDPDSREVFSYQAQIVPGNRVAVPAAPGF
jgi:hypothetical protein